MLDGVIVPVQQMVYSILYFVAETLWDINQAILLVGYYVMSITSWMSQQMFQPLLASIGNSTDSLLLPVFTLAMIILGITYLLGVFGVFRVVEFKSAVIWCAVAVMWFQFGPELYLEFEQFRRALSGGFYGTVFTDVTGAGGTIEGMGQIGNAGDMQIDPPTNNFGAFLTFDTSIDGLDIALAYLDADGCDVLRTTGCLFQPMPDGNNGSMPLMWYQTDGAFDINQHSFFYSFGMTQGERQQSLDNATHGIWMAFSGIVVSFFGLLEQIIQLMLTLAFGIAFASFFIAILFAFFKKTESVTWAVFDIILGLFIQSIITSLLLALVMAFVSVAGATSNGILLLGVGFLGIILIAILLIGAVQAILGALNGLMGAFGKATGGNLGAAGSVTRVTSAYTTGGATLMSGGSLAQTAGAFMGPGAAQKAYYASRAFGNDTFLARAANDVAQGATASYLGPIGGYALGRANTNETASPVEIAGNNLNGANNTIANMTLGTPIRTQHSSSQLGPNMLTLEANGADIRYDPLTAQPYAFNEQANGQGLRTYEDGSRLNTNLDDEPLSRNRAREESRVRRSERKSSEENELSDTSIASLDASNDDENATLLSAIQVGNNNYEDRAPINIPTIITNNSNDNATVSTVTETSTSANDLPLSVTQPTPTEKFLMEVELANPGTVGREDLIEQYFPNDETLLSPQTAVVDIMTDDLRLDLNVDAVTNVPQVGEATKDRLAGAGIHTAGELAHASTTDLTKLGISELRANFLINQAQSYLGMTPEDISSAETSTVQNGTVSNDTTFNTDRLAVANDANNNDDAIRLANGVGIAVRNATSGGGIPTPTQTAQITSQAGLPDIPQTNQFVQVASAMGLSGQQAQTVIQDIQQNNALGSEIAGTIRSSLSTLTLSNGSQLDNTGIDHAVGLLEGAARSLITAASTINNGGNGNTEARDAATVGSTQIQISTINT